MLQISSYTYEKPSAASKVHLMRKLLNLRMAESTAVDVHIDKFTTIISQLNSININFEDEILALVLMSSLPESWNGMVTTVNASTGKANLKFKNARDLIISEELRKKELGTTSGSALSTENKSKFESSIRNRGRSESKSNSNRGRSKLRGKSKSRNDLSLIKCFSCNEFEHYKSQCPKPLKESRYANATTYEICDALALSVSSPL